MKKDVIIIGAGPSGLGFAVKLAKAGLEILVIEKAPIEKLQNPEYDGREIALTHPSVDFLKEIGAWQNIDPEFISPIKEAKVLNGFSDYSLDFKTDQSNVSALGYLVSNNAIRKSLFEQAKELPNIQLLADQDVEDVEVDDFKAKVILSDNRIFECSLIAAADSRFSKMRGKAGISADSHDFARTMIVCQMEHEKSHQNIALECFFEDRVLAILPLNGQKSSIVITVPHHEARDLMALSTPEFNNDIGNYLEAHLGKLNLVSKCYPYPLIGVYANSFVADRFALIGDAAVGMHPVTAHGFNLGLSGQKILSEAIEEARKKGQDIGSKAVLEKYNSLHNKETKLMYRGTNLMVNIFTNNQPSAKLLRKVMLRAANSKFLPFKSMIANRLTGNKNSGIASFLPF